MKLTVEEEFPQGQNLGCTNKQKLVLNWRCPLGYLTCIRHLSTGSTEGAVLVCRVQAHVSAETGITPAGELKGNLGFCVPPLLLSPHQVSLATLTNLTLFLILRLLFVFFLI